MDADTKFLMDEVISLTKKLNNQELIIQMNDRVIFNFSELSKIHSNRIEMLENAVTNAANIIEELRYQVDKLKPSGYND